MMTLDEKTLQILILTMVGVVIIVLLLVLVIFLRLLHRVACPATTTATSTGTFCGHCGTKIPNDPVSAISLGTASYMVYRCNKCKDDTLLPTQ